ncbi:hypothetical protein [Pseudoxanthomonas suwonensis]|uniref:hypothetical protein n=1 Tax=Pseudoxanthomonas suwonensis TaxID=314722 RepID=UPI00138F6DB1|nr:hypothetical protein [Pseudoxanthomonas suwonensis]KAF1699876.1 hypothetical protein CSC68_13505 [Pseudoxanthomonas suwonensis]
MTTAPDSLDRRARQLHAEALAHVSPEVRARLRRARQEAASARDARPWWRLPSWLAGGAVAAALVVAVTLHQPPAPVQPDSATTAFAAAAFEDPAYPLQEDPGFYLWLASADVTALALE